MSSHKPPLLVVLAAMSCGLLPGPSAAQQWQEDVFPPPNAGRLAFIISSDGNPACASYDATNCLWGKSRAEIDFSKVKPLTCGARHRELYGATGFEDPKHWCNLALHAGAASPPPASPPPTAATTPPPTPPVSGYRMTGWSPWGSGAGVQYRYRVGWDPATGGPGKTVDALYEIRNPGGATWPGAARSLDCAQGTLWGSTDIVVAARQTRAVKVRAPNCGTARNPDIKPNLVRQGKFD